MTQPTMESSPGAYARATGILWVIVILAGVASQFLGKTPAIVPGDPATTARNITEAAMVYRLDLAADLVSSVCYLGLSVLLYPLLRPVNSTLSLVAASFGLVGVVTGVVDVLNHFAPLTLLSNAKYLEAVNPEHLQTLAMAFLKLHGLGTNISLVFFGFHCALVGWLVYHAAFLPRTIGVLMVLAGIAYLVSSFASFLAPPLSQSIFPVVAACGLAGEGSLSVRLIWKGVDSATWRIGARS